MKPKNEKERYQGFEQGPIRPPSEAESLLVRVARNCPWNRCSFCPVYKGTRFSIRPVEDVLLDLESVARQVEKLSLVSPGPGLLLEDDVRELYTSLMPEEVDPFRAAVSWYLCGMESVFLQDADSLVIGAGKLCRIMTRLKELFPSVRRITSYARSQTIDRISPEELKALRDAGLNRVHIGMESGSDKVLSMMRKGASKDLHVRAGLKVKGAGMELSEYYMPGLGGCDLWEENAIESADALNRIDPDFIRLRTLAIPESLSLSEEVRAGRFRKCPDILTVREILLFLENLGGLTGRLVSDHILNLLPELEGRFPHDAERMKMVARSFLALEPEERFIFQLGRRLGIMSRLSDIHDHRHRAEVTEAARRLGASSENIDQICEILVKRFI